MTTCRRLCHHAATTKSYIDKLELLERCSQIVLLRAASNATKVASLAVPVKQKNLFAMTESKPQNASCYTAKVRLTLSVNDSFSSLELIKFANIGNPIGQNRQVVKRTDLNLG